MDEKVPAYYIVSRNLTEEQVARAQQIFALTPVSHVIVTSVYDLQLASQFSQFIVRTTPEKAKDMASSAKEPVIVIDNTLFVDAFYADGDKAPLEC